MSSKNKPSGNFLSWRNDENALEAFFQSCVLNWKFYSGTKSGDQIVNTYALYEQATTGDYHGVVPSEDIFNHKYDYLKKKEWYRIRGMPKTVAKRRYITMLGEIDPNLLRIKQDDSPPFGFPLSPDAGRVICAKCNTKTGCSRPLTDQHKTVLQKQLLEMEDLHKDTQLMHWYQNAVKYQQCSLGIHQPITLEQVKPFLSWFDRYENGGFTPYDCITPILQIIRVFVHVSVLCIHPHVQL
jgi:acyl-CoA-binding protein